MTFITASSLVLALFLRLATAAPRGGGGGGRGGGGGGFYGGGSAGGGGGGDGCLSPPPLPLSCPGLTVPQRNDDGRHPSDSLRRPRGAHHRAGAVVAGLAPPEATPAARRRRQRRRRREERPGVCGHRGGGGRGEAQAHGKQKVVVAVKAECRRCSLRWMRGVCPLACS